jgi:hypothetical protein
MATREEISAWTNLTEARVRVGFTDLYISEESTKEMKNIFEISIFFFLFVKVASVLTRVFSFTR